MHPGIKDSGAQKGQVGRVGPAFRHTATGARALIDKTMAAGLQTWHGISREPHDSRQ